MPQHASRWLRRHITALGFAMVATMLTAIGCSPTPTAPTSTAVPAPAPSPARDISGVWTTFQPVTFIHQTDFCGRGIEDVGRSDWNVTWTITAVAGFNNVVDVEMRFTRGGTTATGGCGGASGYVPLVSPTFLRLCISSSELSRCTGETYRNGQAFGPFTADSLTLTWTHRECIVYCYGEITGNNLLKMTRQRS